MINLSERVADSYRKNEKAKANPANAVTSRRRKLYSVIKERTGGDPSAELEYSMKIIQKERPKLENYVISKNEVPADSIQDLILQAYKLRCDEIDSTASMLGVSDGEASIFLEGDEAESDLANNPETENFIGELFAPVGIAAKHITSMEGANNFVDPSLVQGVLGTAGNILDKSALKRAANNKPSGVVGLLTGGKKEYDLLRKYLQDPKNADEKDAVLRGIITDVTQLRGYALGTTGNVIAGGGVRVLANDVIDQIAQQKKREIINKNLPFIIGGLILIIVVTVLIVKNANRNK